MMIVGLLVVAIVLVALTVVAILVVTMQLVAGFMATGGKKMSRLLFFWLLLVLDNLLKNTNHFVDRLTLLKESNELERVCGHCLGCICKLELIRLGLCKEDLFTLLLCCGYLHCLTEVATVKIADELYSRPHELMHWHEGGLLGGTKPADQLVTNIGKSSHCLKVIPDAFLKVCLRTICITRALLGNDVNQLGQAYILKTLTHQVKQHWIIVLLSIQKLSQNHRLEIGERECEEVLSTKLSLVRCDMICNFLSSFLEGNLITIGPFQAFFDQIVWHAIGTQRRPASVSVKLGCVLCLNQI
jgi:hypothetical protein